VARPDVGRAEEDLEPGDDQDRENQNGELPPAADGG
jgi:hypothetical protein